MRDFFCTGLPWLALIFALLGMRDMDPAIPVALLMLILLLWAINWLAHHLSLPWRRFLRILFWALIIGAIVVIPELNIAFGEVMGNVASLQPSILIVLSLLILIVWAVICLVRPAPQSHPQ